MLLFLLACAVSLIPFIAIFFWLRGLKKEDSVYQKICSSAFIQGIISVLPIILVSAAFQIILRLTGIHKTNPLLYQGLYTFIVLASAEELVKYLTFKNVMKKNQYPYSWLDMVVLMTIVGAGFGFIESITYAIGASIPVVLVRGICVPHAGYGFVTGYFYGKGMKTGKPAVKWTGFLLSWLMHGMYDFSLSEEFIALNDNLMAVALLLALLEIVLVIRMIVFVKKKRKIELYTEPAADQI
jgi:RsiW-degrading membrane proteinase PrsW (M82 family)